MKKLFIVLTLVFSFVQNINSQALRPIKFGFKTGMNISNADVKTIEGEIPSNINNNIGIQAGFFIQIPFSENWYMSPEILYSQEGFKYEYRFTTHFPTGNVKNIFFNKGLLKIDFIRLNPQFNYLATKKLFLNFGPSLGYILSYENNLESRSDSIGTINIENSSNLVNIQDIDLGLTFGLDYFLTENFIFNPRIYIGLLENGKIKSLDSTLDKDAFYSKNQSFILSFKFIF